MESIDTVIEPAWLAPVEGPASLLKGVAVAVHKGVIEAILPVAEARARYAPRAHWVLPEHLLIPGLVNAHTHAAMSLMRGLADDLPLMRWLQEAIWPAEARHVSPEFVYQGSLLAAAEMLRGGITTCNDMYFYPGEAAKAFVEMGLRAVIGAVVADFPSPYARDAADYLQKGLSAWASVAGEPLLSLAMAPHAPYSVSDEAFKAVIKAAHAHDVPIHLHLLETAHERDEAQTRFGKGPVERLEAHGLWAQKVLAVHGVFLNEAETAFLAAKGVAVAHCPTSNMKLACGVAPVVRMQAQGVPVCLGTDGAASNNRLDLLEEMRQAGLLAKVSTGDAAALPADVLLRMATLEGARALGLGKDIGSILPGKKADLCALNLGEFWIRPCFNPLSHMVYVASRNDVSHVWVEGNLRLKDGNLLHNRHIELLGIASLWHTKLGL